MGPAHRSPDLRRHAQRGTGARLLGPVQSWSATRSPWPRYPVLLLIGYWCLRHIGDPEYRSVIGGLNFGIHELGHVLFTAFGKFLSIAGGTLAQLAAPGIAGVMFLRQRDYFAVAFAIGWLGTNLFEIAVYAADATARTLPLVGVGSGEPIHDWHYLLARLGLLGREEILAGCLRIVGGFCLLSALALGCWLLALMHGAGSSRRSTIRLG